MIFGDQRKDYILQTFASAFNQEKALVEGPSLRLRNLCEPSFEALVLKYASDALQESASQCVMMRRNILAGNVAPQLGN